MHFGTACLFVDAATPTPVVVVVVASFMIIVVVVLFIILAVAIIYVVGIITVVVIIDVYASTTGISHGAMLRLLLTLPLLGTAVVISSVASAVDVAA